MSKEDYYKTLGINESASESEIKNSYRKMAMKYHPDRNSGDKNAEAKLKKINEAYEVLKNTDKRAAYDNYGHGAFQGGMGGGGSAGGGFQGDGDFHDIFGDVFGDFMGGMGNKKRAPSRGNNLKYELEITLEEAFSGINKVITITAPTKCHTCNGNGADKNSKIIKCSRCNGAGVQRIQQGFFAMEQTCSGCQGTGEIIENPCKLCHGQGRVQKTRDINVKIPAGIDEEMKISLANEGAAGLHGARNGDLYILIYIKSHPLFERSRNDLVCTTTIPMTLAILGGEILVPTIEGKEIKVKIPSGTQSNYRLRISGKGMSILNNSYRGDMYTNIEVETPVNLNDKQKSLIKDFDELSKKTNNSPNCKSFSAKIKNFLRKL